MTSVVSPVPSLAFGLSNGLNGLAELGERQSASAARLDANSRLVDQDAALAALGARSRIDQEVGGFQRLTSILSQATSLTLEAASALNDVRGFLSEAEDFISIVQTAERSVVELQRADVDFQRILEDIETRATEARFDDTAILSRTSAVSSNTFAPPLSADILNVSARNFDNRSAAAGGDGAFTVNFNVALAGGGFDLTATATSAGGLISTYAGRIDAADVDSTTAGSEFLINGKTVVLGLATADANLASLTRERSQIVVSVDAGTLADPSFGGGGAFATTFNIDESATGGALRVEGRAAPVIDGDSDFLVQVQGSILKALGLTNASLQNVGRLQSASEGVQQALDYVDLALADIQGANSVLNNQTEAIALAIDALELGEDAFADFDQAGEFVGFVSRILQGEFAERSTSIAAIRSRAVVGLADTAEARIDINLLEGEFPFEFPNFIDDEATLGLVAQLSVPRQDYVQAIRAGETLSNLGVALPADVVSDGARDVIDQRRAIADLASSIEAIGRPNIPNVVNLLD